MTEIRDQHLIGATVERVSLRGSALTDVRLTGAELFDVEISGELTNVVVNGVDIGPLVDAELDRRMPERAMMRPEDTAGFQQAWDVLEQLWAGTVERARTHPEALLHRRVGVEWSFVQTLRHLGFATAAWVGRMVLGNPDPWHPLDLPWDEAPGWDGISWDRDVQPPLDEVLALRAERQAMVRGVLATMTDAQLASTVTAVGPGWPLAGAEVGVAQCLRIVLNEEWEHRLYAERDLTLLTDRG